jgi:hypothetical protein
MSYPPRKRSQIWKISKEELEKIVKSSNSLSQILRAFLLETKGSNFKTLKQRLDYDGIDFAHIKLGLDSNNGRTFESSKADLKDVLVEKSSYSRYHLKIRLLKEGLLKNICYVCGQIPEWFGKPLSLQIDHINGIGDDNRIENLRMLCPNCHSQTESFAGKKTKKNRDVV